jgi:hypothetical protein
MEYVDRSGTRTDPFQAAKAARKPPFCESDQSNATNSVTPADAAIETRVSSVRRNPDVCGEALSIFGIAVSTIVLPIP